MKQIYFFRAIVLFVMVAFFPQKIYAQFFQKVCSTGQCLSYSILSGSEVQVNGASCGFGDMVIPASVFHNGIEYLVTSINQYAFCNSSWLTSVTIPNSVTSIGSYAFYGCLGLTSVTIPYSVTSIDYSSFDDCSNLSSIIVESGNPIYDSRDNCNAIIRKSDNALITGCKNSTIPNSVTSISWHAFFRCTGLTSVTIPNSVTSIEGNAFYGCSGLTSVTIPNSVTTIEEDAFGGCSGLSSIIVESGNPTYDSRENCNAIIRTSDNALITGCKNSTIPNSVSSILSHAFFRCSGLTSVTIPYSVTSIGSCAFYYCTGLTSITIPNSVTSIESDAFSGCTGLTSITIPNSVSLIASSAFRGCSGLTSITIPNSVISIGSDAFSGCIGLTSITIPNSVSLIASNAFGGCSGLTSITIPNSVTSIESYAFSGCTGLTLITIPNSVSSIASNTFSDCSGLTSVTIPNSVFFIEGNAFSGCTGLTSITIPNSVSLIASNAFGGCSNLTTVIIPNSVYSIGDNPFRGCSNISSIIVENGNSIFDSRDSCNAIIQTADNELIVGCQNTFIPSTVTSIGNYAFYGCSNMDSLTCLATNPPVLLGCACNIFYDVPDDLVIFVPCGSLSNYESAWPEYFNYQELDYVISEFTITTPDSCYIWNNQTYCASGDYTQTLQTVHGCDSVVTLHLTITVGLDDHETVDFKVFPNPTTGILNVQ